MFRNSMMHVRSISAGVALGAAALTLAGCSGSAAPGGTTAAPHTSTASLTSLTSGGAGGAATCGGRSAAAATAALTQFAAVTKVQVVGGCHQLSVLTTMPASDPLTPNSTKALDVCKAVAKVAYVDGVSSISVEWSDGHEAAAAQQGTDCIPG